MASAEDLRRLTDVELTKKELDSKEELFNLEIQITTKQTTNYGRIKQLKKDIARINTIKREKELQIRSSE